MSDFESRVGSALARALEKKGYASLTPVQEAVLETEHAGRDLRISSQTGSGKTLAIGFLLRESVEAWSEERKRPCALVIAPTRELAKQVESELRWIFAEVPAPVTSLTGGASYRDELGALKAKPAIVVGTPGRVLDHLNRKSFDATGLGTVVLDEADRMLDMGFKEELEQIFEHAQEGHRTHLVSATFPREVKGLADRVQTNPLYVEGTPLGEANADIDHVMYVVDSKDRLAAVINLLIAARGGRTLIFVRTREAVANLSRALTDAGFRIESISGDMAQPARNRALAAFKRGEIDALVATDVAARGIDVSDLARVIHADPPGDADTYTHRSGRTGRAGKKGESAILLVPPAVARMQFMLKRARVQCRFAQVPDAATLRKDADEAIFASLSADLPADHELGDRCWELATRLGAAGAVKRVVARLLAKALHTQGVEPREVRSILPRDMDRGPKRYGNERGDRPRYEDERPRPERSRFIEERPFRAREERPFKAREERPLRESVSDERPSKARVVSERASKTKLSEERPSRAKLVEERPSRAKLVEERPSKAREERPSRAKLTEERPSKKKVSADRDTERDLRKASLEGGERRPARESAERSPRSDDGGWVPFRVTWGSLHGADPRRLVAMLCRRGNIEGRQIGSIKIAPHFSTVMVQDSVANEFAEAASERDPHDPKVAIRKDDGQGDTERPAYQRPSRDGAPMRERPSRDGAPMRERPSRDGAPMRERPSRDGAPMRERPSRDGAPMRERPARDGAPMRERPSRDGAPMRERPARDGAERPFKKGPGRGRVVDVPRKAPRAGGKKAWTKK